MAPPLYRRVRIGLLWPLGALAVVGLVAARTLRGTPLPGDGRLTVAARGLLDGSAAVAPFSPDGLAAAHTATYAVLTRAFSRHATLTGAERELLWTALLLGAVLIWRTARRLGVPDVGCALGLLGLGAVLAVVPLSGVATPAALAVPWAALAVWAATRHLRPRIAFGLAAAAVLPAVLLAPDLLLVLVAAGGTALALRTGPPVRTAAVAAATAAGLVVVRLLLPAWAPEATGPAAWGGSTAGLGALGAVLALVALGAGWREPPLRPVAAGLLALVVGAVLPPSGRVSALVLAVPLAALVLAAAVRVTLPARRRARRSGSPGRRMALAGAAALAAVVVLAAASLAAAPEDDFGASTDSGLVTWASGQLPAETVLDADPAVAAALRQAGMAPGLLAAGAPPAGEDSAHLRVLRGPAPPGVQVVARFGDAAGRTLTVVDPAAAPPDPTELDRRRRLGAALLANPTTVAPPAAAQLLRDGEVDPRLLTLLAGLAARSGVQLADLSAAPGEEGLTAVRRAVLSGVGGRPLTEGSAQLDALRTWLDAQRDPLAPDDVRVVDGGLAVGYRYVTDPDGAVTRAGG